MLYLNRWSALSGTPRYRRTKTEPATAAPWSLDPRLHDHRIIVWISLKVGATKRDQASNIVQIMREPKPGRGADFRKPNLKASHDVMVRVILWAAVNDIHDVHSLFLI